MNIAKLKLTATLCIIALALSTAAIFAYATANPSPKPTTRPATQPTTQPAPDLTPKQLVIAAYRTALTGDEQKFLQCFDTLEPDQQTKLKQVVHVMAAVESLKQAMITKYGDNAPTRLGLVNGIGVKESDLQNATQTITGNTAIVDLAGAGPGQIPLVKVNGKWKVSSTLDMPAGIATLEQFVPVLQKLTTDIKSGKYKTFEDLQKAVEALQRQ